LSQVVLLTMNSAILDVDDILDRVTKKVISPFQDKNNSIKILPNMAKEFRVAEYCSIVGEIVGCGHTSLIIPMNRQCIVNREKVLRTENTNNNYMKKELVASLNPNHEIRFISKHFPPPFHDREFLYNIVTLETDANTTVIAEFPSEVFCSFSNPHCVRAEAHAIYILTKLDTNRTQMDYYAHFDLKGRSTNFIGRRFGVLSYIIKKELPNFMSEPLLYKLHFQHLRKLNELNKEDGKNLAIMMTPNNTKIRAEELLNELLQKNAALLEFVETVFPQFKAFWLPILKNQVIADKKEKGFAVLKKMKTAANLKNWTTKGEGEGEGEGEREGKQETESRMIMQPDTPLMSMTDEEAKKIGRAFALFLLTSTEPSVAVDSFRLDNNELQPLFDNYEFFGPMLHTVARELLKGGDFGLKLRIGLGAFLSLSDMITDVTVMRSFFEEGEDAAGFALLAFILSSIVLQLILVFVQNHKKRKRELFLEILFVITFVKPAVDAYRVGVEHEHEHSVVNPLVELTIGKCGELGEHALRKTRVKLKKN